MKVPTEPLALLHEEELHLENALDAAAADVIAPWRANAGVSSHALADALFSAPPRPLQNMLEGKGAQEFGKQLQSMHESAFSGMRVRPQKECSSALPLPEPPAPPTQLEGPPPGAPPCWCQWCCRATHECSDRHAAKPKARGNNKSGTKKPQPTGEIEPLGEAKQHATLKGC